MWGKQLRSGSGLQHRIHLSRAYNPSQRNESKNLRKWHFRKDSRRRFPDSFLWRTFLEGVSITSRDELSQSQLLSSCRQNNSFHGRAYSLFLGKSPAPHNDVFLGTNVGIFTSFVCERICVIDFRIRFSRALGYREGLLHREMHFPKMKPAMHLHRKNSFHLMSGQVFNLPIPRAS